MLRIFGISWWLWFDGSLGLGSLVMTGEAGWRATGALRVVKVLDGRVPAEQRVLI